MTARRRPAVLAPSDVAKLGKRGAPRSSALAVGGRVLVAEPPWLRLADAFGALDVLGIRDSSLREGELVVVRGRLSRGKLVGAELLERQPARCPRGDGDVARFLWGGVGPRLRARAHAFGVIRAYFAEQGFLEVDAPQRVRTPGLDLHVGALRAEGGYLVTSPEFQLKRLLVGGVPRLYFLGHCFRKDEAGPLHEPEFTMLEWYRAFEPPDSMLADTEAIVERVVTELAGKPAVRFADGGKVDVRAPFERLAVREAFRRFAGVSDAVDLAETDEDRFFQLLVDRVEPALARRRRPVFLCEYPSTQASLAAKNDADPRVADRFELYVGGVELSNGFRELTDAREQRARFRADQRMRRRSKKPVYQLDERFLGALEEGLPPSTGNALGVDRLIALALGESRIDASIAFPDSLL